MNTDIKKAVFQAIVGAEDYLQAFENVTRLNLKKQQEREIIKVIVQCCINEKKVFNKFYALLAQRLCRFDPQSFRYSLKYTLWDYLKALSGYDVRQIANLAKLYGMLIGHNDLPVHFLKVLNFNADDTDGLTKPQLLFLYLLFDTIYENHTKEEIKTIFKKGLKAAKSKTKIDLDVSQDEAEEEEEEATEDKLGDFRRGLSEYLLTKFYLKKKKEAGLAMDPILKEKFKVTFDIINKQQEGDFMKEVI